MPHYFNVDTLEELCFQNIGENMDSLWCKDYNENFHGKGEYLYLLGPFSNLPGVLLGKLIHYLKKRGMLKIGHLQVLLDTSIQDVDLSKLSSNMGTILNTVSNRCVNLRHLNLSRNRKLPLQGQLTLFSTARLLETINLSHTNTSDRVMSVIGAYCSRLRELDVSHSSVTDLGLSSLSTHAPDHGDGTVVSLHSLNVSYCDVSVVSAYSILCRMPQLVSLDHPHSLLGVAQLLLRHPERSPLMLTQLRGPAGAHLQLAVQGCPLVQFLHVLLTGDDDVSSAGQLKQLERLVISCHGQPCPGLNTLLKQRGSALSELTLLEVGQVPAELLSLCPNLQTLRLVSCSFTDAPISDSPPLEDLQRLMVLQPLPAPLLRRCLSSPPLREVSLYQCPELGDSLLEELLDAGALRLLRVLELDCCDEVTSEMAMRLVVQCGWLENLSVKHCVEISRRDAAELKRVAQRNGWRLTVDWQ